MKMNLIWNILKEQKAMVTTKIWLHRYKDPLIFDNCYPEMGVKAIKVRRIEEKELVVTYTHEEVARVEYNPK
jgi:hypothetical protein